MLGSWLSSEFMNGSVQRRVMRFRVRIGVYAIQISLRVYEVRVHLRVHGVSGPSYGSRGLGVRKPWWTAEAPILSHRMYLLIRFRNSTAPQNRFFLFTITNQDIKLTILWGRTL